MDRVQVIYYLSHGGHMEQPHLIEMELQKNESLCLSDVKNRLTVLRGKCMPDSFSWAYKRRYKDDFVWSDVTENDPILPLHGNEYIIKGSENIHGKCGDCGEIPRSLSTEGAVLRVNRQIMDALTMAKNSEEEILHIDNPHSDESSNNNYTEVKVYKSPASPITADHGTDASTQTDDHEHAEEFWRPKRLENPLVKKRIDTMYNRQSKLSPRELAADSFVSCRPTSSSYHEHPESMPEVVKETTWFNDGHSPNKPGNNMRYALKTRKAEAHKNYTERVLAADISSPNRELNSRDDRPLTPGRTRLDWERTLQEAATSSAPPVDFRQLLQECPGCGRTFKPESLKIHSRGCHNVQKTRRV